MDTAVQVRDVLRQRMWCGRRSSTGHRGGGRDGGARSLSHSKEGKAITETMVLWRDRWQWDQSGSVKAEMVNSKEKNHFEMKAQSSW